RRTQHAAEFLREIEGASRLRMSLGATAVALVLALGYLASQAYQGAIARLPDVPFEDLPAERQAALNTLINDAHMLEQNGDTPSALDLYLQAYKLHPRDNEAVKGITGLIAIS